MSLRQIISSEKGIDVVSKNIHRFLMESNSIEGIFHEPDTTEVQDVYQFFKLKNLCLFDVTTLQSKLVPNAPLRDKFGLNVRVGQYIPPPGSPELKTEFSALITNISDNIITPFIGHMVFETLHPFMDGNGRMGRIVWAWHMITNNKSPFDLGFLHTFYYQTLMKCTGRIFEEYNTIVSKSKL